ncbi:5986_t:CDS:2, partial [Gigaspora margarita]
STNYKMTKMEDITNFDSEYNYQEGSEMDGNEVTNLNNKSNYQGDRKIEVNGWAFPANAKFGKKANTQEMHMELEEFARSGEIDNDDIPQVSTIYNLNWKIFERI